MGEDESPPDRGYGWVIVAAVAANNAHHWGIVSCYGVFLAYFLSHSEFKDGSSLDYAFIGRLSASQALLIAPLAAIINRQFGLKVTMYLEVLLETAALLGASWSTQIWQLYLSQGICFGWGLGLQVPSFFASGSYRLSVEREKQGRKVRITQPFEDLAFLNKGVLCL